MQTDYLVFKCGAFLSSKLLCVIKLIVSLYWLTPFDFKPSSTKQTWYLGGRDSHAEVFWNRWMIGWSSFRIYPWCRGRFWCWTRSGARSWQRIYFRYRVFGDWNELGGSDRCGSILWYHRGLEWALTTSTKFTRPGSWGEPSCPWSDGSGGAGRLQLHFRGPVMIRCPGEALVSWERLRKQLFLLAWWPSVVVTAATVVIEDPGVIALIGSRAADAVDEHISIGRRGRWWSLVKVLSLRACDFLLLVAAKSKWVAWLGPSAAIAEPRWHRRAYCLLIISVGIGALCQRRCEVEVDRLDTWIAVPFTCEAERRRAEQAPPFPGAAGAGVGARRRGGVDAISHSAWRWRGGKGLLPLAAAAAEDWQAGNKSWSPWAWFTHLKAEAVGHSERTSRQKHLINKPFINSWILHGVHHFFSGAKPLCG